MAAPYSISTNQTGGNGVESTVATMASLHGEVAARRRAIGELIFFAGVNDKHRCKRIVDAWRIKLDAEETCADYDRRTPLHVAAAEGSWATSEWLLRHGASINAVDRFGRTPLEEAVRGEFPEIVQLLLQNGARVCENHKLVGLQDSALAGVVQYRPSAAPEIGIEAEWEIEAQDLQLFNKLGEGEFGEVFKAKYNGTYVAVKQLKRSDQIAIGDFRTEMSTLRRIHHPNAVQFLGACTRSHPYIIVTELMSCSLMTAFQLTFRLTLRRQVEIALEFARAMAYMHNREPKIIHRDLKPANIMIGGSSFMLADTSVLLHTSGIVKVADFGLCKSLPKRGTRPTDETRSMRDREELKDTYRLTGETGSYRYMAPEVFLHEPYNTSVDVYSFAMICYQLFEACVPFEGVDALSAARQAALNNLRPAFAPLPPSASNKDIREELRALLTKSWAADYLSRPSFPNIIKTLEKILNQLGPRKAAPDPANNNGCCAQQ